MGICYWNPQDFNLIPRLTQPTPGLGTFKKKTSFTVYIQYISLSTDYLLLPIDPLPGEIHDVSFHLSILSFLRRCQANTSTCTHTAQAQFSQTGLELFGFYKFMFSIGMWPPWFLSIKREYVILSQEGGKGLFDQCQHICLPCSLSSSIKSNDW